MVIAPEVLTRRFLGWRSRFGAIAGSTIFLFSVDSFLYSELAPRRFGVATAQLEWWAPLSPSPLRQLSAFYFQIEILIIVGYWLNQQTIIYKSSLSARNFIDPFLAILPQFFRCIGVFVEECQGAVFGNLRICPKPFPCWGNYQIDAFAFASRRGPSIQVVFDEM